MSNTPPRPMRLTYIDSNLFNRVSQQAHRKDMTPTALIELMLAKYIKGLELDKPNSEVRQNDMAIQLLRNTQSRVTTHDDQLDDIREEISSIGARLANFERKLCSAIVRIEILDQLRKQQDSNKCVLDRDLTLPDEMG